MWVVDVAGGEPQPIESSRLASFITWAPGERLLYQRRDNRNYRMVDPGGGIWLRTV